MKTRFPALLLLACASTAWAGHPFSVEDMQTIKRIGELRLSPDSSLLVFTVSTSDLKKNKMVTNLFVVPALGGAPRQITFSASGSNTSPRFSPDSKSLYFLSTRAEGKAQVFHLDLSGGEARQVTETPTGVDAFFLSPDGRTIAFVSSVYPECADLACDEKLVKEKTDAAVKARIITGIPFRRWDSWVDGKRNHIFRVSVEGGEAKDLTPGDVDSPIWTEAGGDEMAFSPDGRDITFSRFQGNESLVGNSDLFTIPAEGGTPKPITTNKAADTTPLYSPDGSWIAYSATLRENQATDQVRLFIYDTKTGERKNLFEAIDRSISSYVWSPDSRSLFITFEDQGQEPLSRIDVKTSALTKLVPEGTIGDVQVAKDLSFVVFTRQDLAHPKELYRLSLGKGAAEPVALTHLNDNLMKEVQWGQVRSFTYPGWSGETVQAFEVKPPAFDPSKKYPLLLLMHGGPENAWSNLFHYRWNAELFAAAGYVAILPNFHGSSGFGLKFMDAIKGQWGGAPYEDTMKAVDVALAWPYVDRTRLAAAGASYGGYMANWVEGHTDRFRAIVSHDGLYDLLTMFYSSDLIGGMEAEFKGAPWVNQQAVIDQAPVTFAKGFKTPMLVVHGEKDYRVDPSQGFAMFQTLQAMHVPSKLLYFEDENHWVLKPADSVLWYHTVLDWLAEWVAPDEDAYQKKRALASTN